MTKSKIGEARVGPAGWAYEDWKGVVYPSDMPRGLHPLTFLCEKMDAMEVNSTFYRPPTARVSASWVQKVKSNPRFTFTVKLWERFTHERDMLWSDADVKTFIEGIAPLSDQRVLGAVLIQFPWSFRRTTENRGRLARILDAFARLPLALEVRHASWNMPELFKGLADRGVAFCNIDQPIFADSIEPSEAVTAQHAYVRFHGRNKGDWFREGAHRNDRYNYLYSTDELRPWVERIQRIRRAANVVYVITNNHYRGQAVVNALELQAALAQPAFKEVLNRD